MESRDAITIRFDTIDQLVESCLPLPFHKDSYSRSRDAVIRVNDDAGNVIETHEHAAESEADSQQHPGPDEQNDQCIKKRQRDRNLDDQ